MTSPSTNQNDFIPMEVEDTTVEIVEDTQERSSETLEDLRFIPLKDFSEESDATETCEELPEVMNASEDAISILQSDSGMSIGLDLDPGPTIPPFAPTALGILPDDFSQGPSDSVPDPSASPTYGFIFDETPEDDYSDGFPLTELEQREHDATYNLH